MTLKMNEVEPDEATWTHLKNMAIAKWYIWRDSLVHKLTSLCTTLCIVHKHTYVVKVENMGR